MEEKVILLRRTYKDLKDNNLLVGVNDPYGVLDSFTVEEKDALLDKPTGYDESEVAIIMAAYKGNLIGCFHNFTTRFLIDGEVHLAQTGSEFFTLEQFRYLNAGAFIYFDATRLLKTGYCLAIGISQMAMGLYPPLKFNMFFYPRLIYASRSKSVVHKVLKSESIILNPIIWLVDLGLSFHRFLLRCYASLRLGSYVVEETGLKDIDEIVRIVNEDEHPCCELHDKQWFEWCLKYTFREGEHKEKKVFTIKKEGKVCAFFMSKKEFYEQASTRGFKNVWLNTIMEWGISKGAELKEHDLNILAVNQLAPYCDAIQMATDNPETLRKLKRKMFVRIGDANMAVRLRNLKPELVSNQSNWRLRIAGGDTFIE